MGVVEASSGDAGRRSASLGQISLLALLGALAYHPLVLASVELTRHSGFEEVMFRPSKLPTPLVLAVVGWLLWRRRARWGRLPRCSAPWLAGAALGVGTGFLVWAELTQAVDLLLISLAANLLGFAALRRGRAGFLSLLLPALVLLLGVPIPMPLQDELVWQLQRWSASGSAWLLSQLGSDSNQSGVILHVSGHRFQVIDACSGFSGIEILVLIALITRELFAATGWRSWLPVLLAPGLGYALNVIRIAYIASNPSPEALEMLASDHTPQGIAVLSAGTALLYALSRWLSGRVRDEPASAGDGSAEPPPSGGMPWRTAAWLAGLAILSFTLRPFELPPGRPAVVSFPESAGDWTSETLAPDPFFIGPGLGRQALYRRYERPGAPPASVEYVDLFVGIDAPSHLPSNSWLSSKRAWPGPEWNLERKRSTQVWVLDQDSEFVIASRSPGGEHAVVYTWRLGDEGLWWESWRSFLKLEATPLRRREPRVVVRMVAFSPHDGALALDLAKRHLDGFVASFRDALEAL